MLDDGSVVSSVVSLCVSMTWFRVARKRKMLVWQTGGKDKNITLHAKNNEN